MSHVIGSLKRRGIVDLMDVDYVLRKVKSLLSSCVLNEPYWRDFVDERQCMDLTGIELEVLYCTRLARRKRSNERSRQTLDLNFDSKE